MNKSSFSKIIAGTMTWGIWGKNSSKQEIIELIHCCLENNITTFDHADIYGDYTTEAAFGKALSDININRSKLQLISKCGIQLQSENRKNAIKHYNYSAAYIIASVEQSLKNLKTDYLDLLLLHRPSPLMHAEDIAEAIEQLKKDGKIIDFGVSNFTPSQTDLIQTQLKVNYNQIKFSITDFEAMLNGSLDHMLTHKITPMCWSPFGTVFKEDNEKTHRIKNIGEKLALKYNVSIEAILLAWLLKHPAGIIPVCGTSNVQRISNLMKSTSIELELEDWFMLLQSSSGVPVP